MFWRWLNYCSFLAVGTVGKREEISASSFLQTFNFLLVLFATTMPVDVTVPSNSKIIDFRETICRLGCYLKGSDSFLPCSEKASFNCPKAFRNLPVSQSGVTIFSEFG